MPLGPPGTVAVVKDSIAGARRHATVGCARPGTVLGQPEEKEIGPAGTDIGIEELRPSRAAGGRWK